MKRLITTIFLFLMAYGNPADFVTVIVDGVDRGDYSAPMAYSIDYLPEGTHHVTLVPHRYVDHVPVQVDMTVSKRSNKKFTFWQMVPQPGDEIYFDSTLKVKVKK